MKAFFLFRGHRGKNRVKAIWLLERGQIEALKVLLDVSRSTVYGWRKQLRENGGNVTALAPLSRAPKRRRQREVDVRLIEFIRKCRIQRPWIGKGIIKAELDQFCEERSLKTISESTIGRIISDLQASNRLPGRGLQFKVIDNNGHLICKKKKPRKVKKRRCGYQPKEPGDLLQMDSLAIFRDGIKRYLFTAIDLDSRFAFAYCYTSLNRRNATDFLAKLIEVAPFKMQHIQTDNGSEFDKDFAIAIRDSPIQHFHNYPKHPQSNAYVERFNRTFRSQFIEYYEEDIENTKPFNQNLIEYLLWYNIQKSHRGIGNHSLLEYYMQSMRPHRPQSKTYWTPTLI